MTKRLFPEGTEVYIASNAEYGEGLSVWKCKYKRPVPKNDPYYEWTTDYHYVEDDAGEWYESGDRIHATREAAECCLSLLLSQQPVDIDTKYPSEWVVRCPKCRIGHIFVLVCPMDCVLDDQLVYKGTVSSFLALHNIPPMHTCMACKTTYRTASGTIKSRG